MVFRLGDMAGETNLAKLLRNLNPSVRTGAFVYVATDRDLPAHARIVEREGATLVMEQSEAEAAGLEFEGTWAWITLEVLSSLEAVGLTAEVSTALARAGISCNMLAGFHHDHLLIPADRLDDAMKVLSDLKKPRSRAEKIVTALGFDY